MYRISLPKQFQEILSFSHSLTLDPQLIRSEYHCILLDVDLVAAGIQLLFATILNVLFYLDERPSALALCVLFAIANGILTYTGYLLGPLAYGYGFATAVLLSALAGMSVLGKRLQDLEYKTFVLQPVRY